MKNSVKDFKGGKFIKIKKLVQTIFRYCVKLSYFLYIQTNLSRNDLVNRKVLIIKN